MLSGPYILYQPHVHQDEGVLSPDVLIKELSVIAPDGGRSSVSVFRLTTAVMVPEFTARTIWCPAVVLVAASRGPIAAPATVHADKTVIGQDLRLALQATSKPIGRSALRLSSDECSLSDITLKTGQSASLLSDFEPAASGLVKGQAVLACVGDWQDTGTGQVTVALQSKQGQEVSHSYHIQPLGSGASS